MDTQTTQPIVLDSEQLKQLKAEIQEEMLQVVNNSNLSKLLAKYGLLPEEVITINYSIDLSKVQLSDAVPHEEVNQFVPTVRGNIQPDCGIDPITKQKVCW